VENIKKLSKKQTAKGCLKKFIASYFIPYADCGRLHKQPSAEAITEPNAEVLRSYDSEMFRIITEAITMMYFTLFHEPAKILQMSNAKHRYCFKEYINS